MDTSSIPLKRCSRCKNKFALNAANFSKCISNKKDGYLNYCKRCAKEKHDEWVSKNRGHLNHYNQQRRIENPELFRTYEQKNKSRHHKRMLRYWRQWAVNNPDKVKAKHQRRRAHKANAIGSHTDLDIDILNINQRNKCAYCGCQLGNKYHVDHIVPLSRGGSDDFDNLTLACVRCNLSKGDKLLSEWHGTPPTSQ